MSWIKIETTLISKPEVMQLSSTLDASEFEVVGHLVAFWAWVDANMSPECPAVIGTKSGLDRVCGRTGMVDALIDVGWLHYDGKLFSVPNIDRHLSRSAKQRVVEARKKASQRKSGDMSPKCPDGNGTKTGQMSRSHRDKSGTREEKIREEQSPTEIVLNTCVETSSPEGTGVSKEQEQDPCDFTILSCNVNAWGSAFREVRVPSALAIYQNDALAWAEWLRNHAGPNFDAGKLQSDLQAAVKLGNRFPGAVTWAIKNRKDALPKTKHDPPARIDFDVWHQMRLAFDVHKNPFDIKADFGTEAIDAWLKLAQRHMNPNLSDDEARRAFAQEFLSSPGVALADEFFKILESINA